MRKILATALLALPSLVSAQALHTGISHLVASVDAPAFAFQAGAVSAAAPHLYTGLIAPIRLNAFPLALSTAAPGVVTVEYTVDKTGVPEDIHVTGAGSKETGERVAAVVQKLRYTPGKLNGQPVDVPVILHVDVK